MTTDQEKTNSDGHVFCAHCGTENSKDTYSCDRCGEKIYFPDPLKPPPMGIVECQNCLTANESRASYCVKCGESLTNAARINVLGSGDSARKAPHTQPGGIRLRQRDREPTQRPPSSPDPKRPEQGPPSTKVPPTAPGARIREPEREREQREDAREKAGEQERQSTDSNEGANDSGTRSGRLPKSAKGWNTAAFLIGPIWGPANGVWLGVVGILFFVIPESILTLGLRFTLYLAFGAFLGFRGNEMAWRARRWPSLQHFRRVQQQWMLVALVVNLVLLFLIPILLRG